MSSSSTRLGVISSVGRRQNNEDSCLAEDRVGDLSGGPLAVLAVADGMGGLAGGKEASSIAIGGLAGLAQSTGSIDEMIQAVQASNAAVHAAASSRDARIGTTLTVAVVDQGVARVAHVGDSRAYWMSGGQVARITDDHSLVGEMVREGTISEEEARTHGQRNVLKRAIGIEPHVRVDTAEVVIGPGDCLLLCSDGLHGFVRDEEMAAIVANSQTLDEAAKKMTQLALDRGGDDNITVVLWRYPGGRDAQGLQRTRSGGTQVSAPPRPGGSDLVIQAGLVFISLLAGFVVGIFMKALAALVGGTA